MCRVYGGGSLIRHSYEERAKNFETVIQQHVDFTMFEDFAANVFAPVLPQNATSMSSMVYVVYVLLFHVWFHSFDNYDSPFILYLTSQQSLVYGKYSKPNASRSI